MSITLFIAFSMAASGGGVAAGVYFARLLARRWSDASVPMDSSSQVLQNAEWRCETAIKTAQQTTLDHLDAEAARLEEERDVVRRIQAKCEQELNERQSALDKRANELTKFEEQCQAQLEAIAARQVELASIQDAEQEVRVEWVKLLETKANSSRDEVSRILREDVVNAEKLLASKALLESTEEIKFEAQRLGKEVLNTVNSRYNPKFVWPKNTFSVETPSKALAEEHFYPASRIITSLTEGLGIAVDLIPGAGDEAPTIKISGGAGIEKEALRRTFEEVISRREFNLDKVVEVREKFRRVVDKEILLAGERAAKELGIAPLHPELLKLVGSLNYRTSHRQNQYYHSVEVARLAGMLADELGVDHQLAKRSGFLHDIGKALDYRIDGSHAVISADYAERFGEAPQVVETVLSHHDDKIVETPFAYILKAADAMSGARPGARVEMEEGYQKRIESIADVVRSFENSGVHGSAIMNAGREVHVFVDSRRVKERDAEPLCAAIVKKLETDVEFPGQIRVTVVRRTEVSEVA